MGASSTPMRLTIIDEKLFQKYHTTTQNHIDLVYRFGQSMGWNFCHHDDTKYDPVLIGGFICAHASTTGYRLDKDQDFAKLKSIFEHVKQESHHPEYWDPHLVWKNYTLNPVGFNSVSSVNVARPVNAHKMNEAGMCEMATDICARSVELGSDAHQFVDTNFKNRWKFKKVQQTFIHDRITALLKNKDRILSVGGK